MLPRKARIKIMESQYPRSSAAFLPVQYPVTPWTVILLQRPLVTLSKRAYEIHMQGPRLWLHFYIRWPNDGYTLEQWKRRTEFSSMLFSVWHFYTTHDKSYFKEFYQKKVISCHGSGINKSFPYRIALERDLFLPLGNRCYCRLCFP